jgi:hypothetical protein
MRFTLYGFQSSSWRRGCSMWGTGCHHLTTGSSKQRGVAWPWNLSKLTYSFEGFLAALGSSQQEWNVFAAAHPAGSGPVWEWAEQEAGLEVQRLVGVLPPELQQAAADARPQYKSRRTGTLKL